MATAADSGKKFILSSLSSLKTLFCFLLKNRVGSDRRLVETEASSRTTVVSDIIYGEVGDSATNFL